jgi:hypothetical protein
MTELGDSTWYFPSKINITNGEIFDAGGYFRTDIERSANQSVNSSSWTYISWDYTQYDVPSGHESSPNPTRYTCQEDGLYLVSAGVYYKSTRTDFRLQDMKLRRNGADVAYGKRTAANNANGHWNYGQVAHVIPLTDGQYIEIQIYQQNTAAQPVNVTAELQVTRVGINPT